MAILRASWLLSLTLIGLGALPALAQERALPARGPFRVAGYLPEYRAKEFDADIGRPLTDLIVFSADITPTGGIDLSRLKTIPWAELRTFKTAQRVRLILCLGGWNRSAGFAAVATSPEKRRAFAEAAVRLCLEEQLDGLDLDWEHPKGATEEAGYGQLLADLREAFRPHGLVLSVTVAAWQKLPKEAFAAVDWVQVMAYDHAGRHSTPEAAEADVKSLLDRGVPAEKIVLGLPFYGRHLKQRNQSLTYRQIVAKHRPAATVDEVEEVYFNGPDTIRRKTQFALQSRLGGVMVWELGQDARGEGSLLKTIRATVDGHRD